MPLAAPRLRSLSKCLGKVSECRKPRGKRYPLRTVLTIAVAARLAGYRGVTAFALFAALLSQEQLEAVESFFSPKQEALHRALDHHLPQHLSRPAARDAGQRHRTVDREETFR